MLAARMGDVGACVGIRCKLFFRGKGKGGEVCTRRGKVEVRGGYEYKDTS